MKKAIPAFLFVPAFLAACNCEHKQSSKETAKEEQLTVTKTGAAAAAPAAIKSILTQYLRIKNALAADQPEGAAAGATALIEATNQTDSMHVADSKKDTLRKLMVAIREQATIIASHGNDAAAQRTGFETLSNKIYTLIKTFGTSTPVYKDFCPMAFDGKGAFWLSESKDIRNPYYGSEMLECGEVQEEIR